MEVLVLVAVFITLPVFGYMLGRSSASGEMFTIKRENEQLNKELHRLTDRDERGRFKRSK
jgi:multisubunit Na+/H+ antiporter MnhG subunit